MIDWNETFEKGAKYKPLNVQFLDILLSEVERITGKKPQTAIDLGCGIGDSLMKLSRCGLKVVGIDGSSVALEQAKELLKEKGVEAEIHEMDIESLSYKGKADIILCRFTYAFIEKKEEFLINVQNIMEDGGVFILITPVLYPDIEYTKIDKPKIAVPFDETKVLLEKVFRNVTVHQHEYFGDHGDTVTFLIEKKRGNAM